MKYVKIFLGILFSIGLFIFGFYNMCHNNKFWETNFTTLVSIAIAVLISYFFVQHRTDERRKQEKIDKLLYKIQGTILDENFLIIKEEDLIIQRSIVNKIGYIKENVKNKNNKKDVERIEELFSQYRDFYGNHYLDVEYMKKSNKELQNYISRIDDICDALHMKFL